MQRPRIRTLLALLALICATAITVHAREIDIADRPSKPERFETHRTPIEPVLDPRLPGDNPPPSLGPVVAFLELHEPQILALVSLLEQRDQTVAPIAHEIAELEFALEQLLESPDPEPPVIGSLVLQIRQRRAMIHAAQAEFLTAFETLLDDTQQQKLHAARTAKALQPVLPALGALGLI